MPDDRKESENIVSIRDVPYCRACGQIGKISVGIVDFNNDKGHFIICGCGCIYPYKRTVKDPKAIYTENYKQRLKQKRQIHDHFGYWRRVFLPIIEEATQGRRFLDVGFGLEDNIIELEKRGWLADGIDLISNKLTTADFETYDYGHKRYDLIYFGMVLQCFDDPLGMIRKAYSLLNQRGILFINTPQADLVFKTGYVGWGHWNAAEHGFYFSKSELERQLRLVGFEIPLSYTNTGARFVAYNDMFVIAQKMTEETNGKITIIGDSEQGSVEHRGTGSIIV